MMRLVCACLIVLACMDAGGHDARPVSVRIVELPDHGYRVSVREPPSLPAAEKPAVRFPEDCKTMVTGRYHCAGPMDGRKVLIDYPRANPSLSTFVRFRRSDGTLTTELLPPDRSSWTVPAGEGGAIPARYTGLGMAHIALGPDHLLFVACLVVLAWGERRRRWRRLVMTITGFTLAHSLTLALSVLNIVYLPVTLVEALIAASIMLVAAEIPGEHGNTWTARYPVAIASAFGLLHGLGFAAVLKDIGLPPGDVPLALLAFNAGVEIGQVLFIAVLLAATWMTVRLAPGLKGFGRGATAYVAGCVAAFWVIERTLSFWT